MEMMVEVLIGVVEMEVNKEAGMVVEMEVTKWLTRWRRFLE